MKKPVTLPALQLNEDTNKNATISRHQKKEKWETNDDKTNSTYKTIINAQKKEESNRNRALVRSVGN